MRRYELDVNGKSFSITVREFTAGEAELEIDGVRYTVHVDDVISEGPKPSVIQPKKSLASAGGPGGAGDPGGGSPAVTSGKSGASGPAGGRGAAGSVTAPIPGQVLEIRVATGAEVKAGQPVVIMEAMKMENVISAPVGGKVGSILVNAGDAVSQGQELLVIV